MKPRRSPQSGWFVVLGLLLVLAPSLCGQPVQTLDLKPFVGFSPFDVIGALRLPQRGLQVIDGTPFQIDGVIIMYGDYQSQRNRLGKTNVTGIAVGRGFECLHLFAGAQAVTADGTPLKDSFSIRRRDEQYARNHLRHSCPQLVCALAPGGNAAT